MNDKLNKIVEDMTANGWRWVRQLSTPAYYRYCYDRRFNKVKPPEKKVEKLVFISTEQFKNYEEGKSWTKKGS